MKFEMLIIIKKLSNYKTYINMAEVTEIKFSSITTTAPTTSVALTCIRIPYSIPAALATATIRGSILKTINTKKRNNIIRYSHIFVLTRELCDNN